VTAGDANLGGHPVRTGSDADGNAISEPSSWAQMSRPPVSWPAEFAERMAALLGPELAPFLAALSRPRARGLRLNPAKVEAAELARLLRLDLEPVPWCATGFSIEDRPGLGAHPAHAAGLFYLQDPAAMSAVEVMDPAPDWRVIDLAAAPGGKTTHLLSRLGPQGIVLANEVIGRRLRPLHENLDRWGSTAAVTARAELEELAEWFPQSFDAALLDAPCSGEALMRRDPSVMSQWSPAVVAGSARRQRRLLELATRLVRPGGVLVYSTCTFEVEENEAQVAALLEAHPDWELVEAGRGPGFEPGVRLPPWPTERAARLWPHHVHGDGQFVARLQRKHAATGARLAGPDLQAPAARRDAGHRHRSRARADQGADRLVRSQWESFSAETCPDLELPPGRLVTRASYLYHLPAAAEQLSSRPLARPGTPLGAAGAARFQPSQALACVLEPRLVADHVSWREEDDRLARYLHGETVDSPGADGWVLVCYERWGVGWGRRSKGVIKNFLPHHLRSRTAAGVRAAEEE
jgi:16S rRNA C967 or C1407 C5-methylase (RsmB/RsmF family)/NOL1/NOP2/fmu family ribosome biogenesis protein